jgi:hypothetical protein
MSRIMISKEDLEGTQCPPGTWVARIDRVTERESEKKNKVILLGWKVVGSEPPAGSDVLENITLVPEAMWKLAEVFEATGFTPDADGFETADLKGLECRIVVAEEEYQGRKRAKVMSHARV